MGEKLTNDIVVFFPYFQEKGDYSIWKWLKESVIV